MANKNYDEMSKQIVEYVGGIDNISTVTHCATRLRFTVKNKSDINVEALKSVKGIIGTKWYGEQFQVIVGQDVDDVYMLICKSQGLKEETVIDENLDGTKKKFSLGSIFEILTACVAPCLPAFIGCGVIKGLCTILGMSGVLSTTSSTYQILTMLGDVGFYFIPIIAAYSSALRFKVTPVLAMVVCGLLLYPSFTANIASGTEMNFLGIPVYSASYASQIFPSILTVFVMSFVEKFIRKHSPNSLRSVLVPLFTLLVMTPLCILVLAPIGNLIGTGLTSLILMFYDKLGFLGVGLLAAFFPFLVMLGAHTTFTPIVINTVSNVGFEPFILVASFIYQYGLGASALAIGIKSKKSEVKSTSLSASFTAIIGAISEPAVFGVFLIHKAAMKGTMIGALCGGILAGILKIKAYSFAGWTLQFLGGSGMNYILAVVCTLVSMVLCFIFTFIFYKDEEDVK